MHQFFKDVAFVTAVAAAFIGIPFGTSELIENHLLFGGAITLGSGLALALSFLAAAYYHNRKIDVTLLGYLAGFTVVFGGSSFMILSGFVDTIVFVKLFIVALAVFLHAMVEEENAFWLQKLALATALVSVAFLSTIPALAVGAGITFVLFIVSMILHIRNAEQEGKGK